LQQINSGTLGIGSFNVTGPAAVDDTNTTIAWAADGAGISADNSAIERFFGETTAVAAATIDADADFAADLGARLGIAAGSVTGTAPANGVQMDDNGNLFAQVTITTSDATEIENLAARGLKVESGVATNFYIALDPADGTVDGAGTAVSFELTGADLDISSMSTGSTANPLANLDEALNKIDSLRSELGAVQNRFEDAISNLGTNETNLSAARSRIEDADYAVEVANMTRAQILQQAGTSVLAQANQIPQNVLSLLG
jgi:flagellin